MKAWSPEKNIYFFLFKPIKQEQYCLSYPINVYFNKNKIPDVNRIETKINNFGIRILWISKSLDQYCPTRKAICNIIIILIKLLNITLFSQKFPKCWKIVDNSRPLIYISFSGASSICQSIDECVTINIFQRNLFIFWHVWFDYSRTKVSNHSLH